MASKGDGKNGFVEKSARITGKAIKWIVRKSDELKQLAEPSIDKYLFLAAANTGAVYEAIDLIDRSDYSDPTNLLIGMGTGAALVALDYTATASRRARSLRRLVGKLNAEVDNSRTASWVKTLGLGGSMVVFLSGLNPYYQQVRQDIFPRTRDTPLVTAQAPRIPEVPQIKERPKAYGTFSYGPAVAYDFTGTKLADKNSMTGRIQRTLRWQPTYRAVEAAHGLPQDTLAGMIMQESYGDPVQPNASNDGGLGVVHIQGTTAKLYGLNIYGASTTDSDRTHGRQIRDMLRQCKYNASCAQKYDDRAHLIKVLDAAARIVREGKEKHGNWDAGVEYYRAPGKVGRNLTWRYLHNVKKWRGGIQNQVAVQKAAEDFEKRNESGFNDYISKWHQMNNNWGLKEYASRRTLSRLNLNRDDYSTSSQ